MLLQTVRSVCEKPNKLRDQTGYPFHDLISPDDMTIDSYELGVLYDDSAAGPSYPLTFIRIMGYAGERAQDQTFVDLETAVSARTSQ